MNYSNLFRFEVNFKSVAMLAVLAILPNLLGMVNLPTVFGLKIHTFQYVVFIAAALYGPFGGAVSGGFGSLFTAVAMGNPYIVVGNIILGFTAGFLIRKGFGMVTSALAAFAMQLPWLWATDVYIMGMPPKIVGGIVVALLISNIIWAVTAKLTYRKVAGAIGHGKNLG